MTYPERFSNLPDYAFPRLRTLLAGTPPGGKVCDMTIGQPGHGLPGFVAPIITEHMQGFATYPPNPGTPELLKAITGWLKRRYGVSLDPETQVMALNGTREGLFNACLALCPEQARNGDTPTVLIPNPFYQVYAVAAAAAGAEPVMVPATEDTGFLPDFASLPEDVLNRAAIAYICSPSNPQGAVADTPYWQELIAIAQSFGFTIFADECYSEIYRDTPPPGALEMAATLGADPESVVSFHSLSKRSNLPGLRSGFVASGPENIKHIKQLRAYAGAPLPLPLQRVAELAWCDEAHVEESRALYRQKYALADEIFSGWPGYRGPQGGFFLWLRVADSEQAALKAWRETGVKVLPGAYLGRAVNGENPGAGYIRVAMVTKDMDELQDGLTRLRDCLAT
ncbi:aminotransferase class I/II-fold pyridoxal phosphate-dependent enzyme [Vannielia sp.]|uniref:aminotransferase class I/II-fold pyridoxal phosphate-dependent enzyme n=1 Tax=Vannielia sp. TaxID=2813045 RepID=UPI002612F42A|nr:aminotransferase class I/II-fold pyridoxal phosphate-dependent enzyme [Vannielia sp.]MDF1871054.1 aminotransferase class I/II-fold pyridoxal phosphate-dependent enzyme [Vannielia sp.]